MKKYSLNPQCLRFLNMLNHSPVLLAFVFALSCFIFISCQYNKKTNNEWIIEHFHKMYYNSGIWKNTFFLGIPIQQNPCDMWMMQELIVELKPDIIIETGTYKGGSAIFFASILENINPYGKVITVDINPQIKADLNLTPLLERIEIIKGNSISPAVIRAISNLIKTKDIVLVTLDSLHTKHHVLTEMRLYSRFVSVGSYLIVQDTNLNGHPVRSNFGPGPMEAVEEFLEENDNFVIDRSKEKYFLTFYPSGWLKRIK